MQISINTSGSRVIFEEENFVTHINTSPKLPNIITFCHEGPWQLVDHRIWGLDINSGEVWKIRERTETSEMVGHEFWHDEDRKSTRLNSSHVAISYAVFCLKKKKQRQNQQQVAA